MMALCEIPHAPIDPEVDEPAELGAARLSGRRTTHACTRVPTDSCSLSTAHRSPQLPSHKTPQSARASFECAQRGCGGCGAVRLLTCASIHSSAWLQVALLAPPVPSRGQCRASALCEIPHAQIDPAVDEPEAPGSARLCGRRTTHACTRVPTDSCSLSTAHRSPQLPYHTTPQSARASFECALRGCGAHRCCGAVRLLTRASIHSSAWLQVALLAPPVPSRAQCRASELCEIPHAPIDPAVDEPEAPGSARLCGRRTTHTCTRVPTDSCSLSTASRSPPLPSHTTPHSARASFECTQRGCAAAAAAVQLGC